MSKVSKNIFKRSLAVISLVAVLSNPAFAVVQILNANANTKNDNACGKYNLKYAKLILSDSTSSDSNQSSIKIVSAQGNIVSTKNISVGQTALLEVGVEQSQDQQMEDIELILRQDSEDGQYFTYDRITIPAESGKLVRTVNFSKALKPGTYQVAISCTKIPALLPVAAVGGGVALGALIHSATNGNGGASVIITPETPSGPSNPTNNNNGNNSSSGNNSNNGNHNTPSEPEPNTPSEPEPNTPSSASP